MASAEDETARLIREGVERMEEMEGRIVESEMRREKAEEKYNELERKLVSCATANLIDIIDKSLRVTVERVIWALKNSHNMTLFWVLNSYGLFWGHLFLVYTNHFVFCRYIIKKLENEIPTTKNK